MYKDKYGDLWQCEEDYLNNLKMAEKVKSANKRFWEFNKGSKKNEK